MQALREMGGAQLQLNCKKKRLKLFSKMKTGLKVVPRPEQHT